MDEDISFLLSGFAPLGYECVSIHTFDIRIEKFYASNLNILLFIKCVYCNIHEQANASFVVFLTLTNYCQEIVTGKKENILQVNDFKAFA